jgi:hypothetical protein
MVHWFSVDKNTATNSTPSKEPTKRRCVCRSSAGACAALSQKFRDIQDLRGAFVSFPKPLREEDTRKELRTRQLGLVERTKAALDLTESDACVPIDTRSRKKKKPEDISAVAAAAGEGGTSTPTAASAVVAATAAGVKTTKTSETRPLEKARKSTYIALWHFHPAVLVKWYDKTNKCIKTSKDRTIAGQFLREIQSLDGDETMTMEGGSYTKDDRVVASSSATAASPASSLDEYYILPNYDIRLAQIDLGATAAYVSNIRASRVLTNTTSPAIAPGATGPAKKRAVVPSASSASNKRPKKNTPILDAKTLNQHRRDLGSQMKKVIQVKRWSVEARTSMETTISLQVFQELIIPHANTVVPEIFDDTTPVVVASVTDGIELGQIFGKAKIKGGHRFETWSADKGDLIFYPPTGVLRVWWTMQQVPKE